MGSPATLAVVLEHLDDVERIWRDALSLVNAEEVERAQVQIGRAGEALGRLASLRELLDDETLGLSEVVARLRRLEALHAELLKRCHAGLEQVKSQLKTRRVGGRALRAYASRRAPGRSLDRTN